MDIVEFQGGKYHLLTDGMGGFKLSPLEYQAKPCSLAQIAAEGVRYPTASEINESAMKHIRDRASTYDQPQGERSMGKTVRAFNAITGRDLTESEGWLLLQVLKDVRQWQNPNEYHQDSGEDCIAYAALKAESLAGGR